MRRLIIAFILTIIFSITGNAQSLSLDEMISLYNKDIGEATDYLITKNWQYSRTNYDSIMNSRTAVFAYAKDYNNKASAWIHKGDFHVRYQTSNKAYYEAIKTKIKSYNMQLVKSELTVNGVESTYEGKNYAVLLIVSTVGEFDKAVYIAYLYKKRKE